MRWFGFITKLFDKMNEKEKSVVIFWILIGCCCVLAMAPVLAPYVEPDSRVIVSEVVSVYDGDTFKIDMNDWPDIVGDDMSIRIVEIDTPEIRGSEPNIKELAQEAKDFTASKLRNAQEVELRELERDKYFRILAKVFVDGENLGNLLIERGLAKPYDGGTRPEWTQEDYDKYFNENREADVPGDGGSQ